ncbi:hypothetical protein EDB83DRAFT_545080 [Lactarius deliciosus]|nr:hypothetical protein EDB83DRAFT_545080 [Lactarius deliciosus]
MEELLPNQATARFAVKTFSAFFAYKTALNPGQILTPCPIDSPSLASAEKSGFNTTSVKFDLPLTVFNFHDFRGLTPSLKRTWLARVENCPKYHCLSRSLARPLPIPTSSDPLSLLVHSFAPSPTHNLPRCHPSLYPRCLITPVPAGAIVLSPCCRFFPISLLFVPARRCLFPLLRPALCHAAFSHRRAPLPCIKPCSRWSTWFRLSRHVINTFRQDARSWAVRTKTRKMGQTL